MSTGSDAKGEVLLHGLFSELDTAFYLLVDRVLSPLSGKKKSRNLSRCAESRD
jgi:hypothetical protein